MWRVGFVAVVLVVAGFPPARAGDTQPGEVSARGPSGDSAEATDAAAAHLRNGLELYSQQKYDQALTEFQLGFALVQSPNLRFNIALAYCQLGMNAKARAAFEAVAADPNADAELKQLARDQIARLAPPVDLGHATPVTLAAAVSPAAPMVESNPGGRAQPEQPRSRRRSYLWWVFGAAVVTSLAATAFLITRGNDDCHADLCRDVYLKN